MAIFYKPAQGDTAATVAEGYDRNFRELDERKETPAGAQEKADAAQNAAVREAAIKAEAALRNAKEYTDVRETAILAAADAKDETTLRTAKEYADRIVAALAGSAPELMDTLEELAAALGNDPNFSATVMQTIGERVTKDELSKVLAGKVDRVDSASEDPNRITTGSSACNNLKQSVGVANDNYHDIYTLAAYGTRGTQILREIDDNTAFYVRGTKKWSSVYGPAYRLYHSGNFNPERCFKSLMGNITTDAARFLTQSGGYANSDNSNWSGALLHFQIGGSLSAIQIMTPGGGNVDTKIRFQTDGSATGWSPWYTLYTSANLKPIYYAQIDPSGGIISKSADWIQSVTWKSDGYGMQCYILPKMAVNLATAHVTKVRVGGNTFKGRAPVVCDELLDGCIVVATPGDNGASEQSYFNISIQGA